MSVLCCIASFAACELLSAADGVLVYQIGLQLRGCTVVGVLEWSPASCTAIGPGDIVTAVNGVEVDNTNVFPILIGSDIPDTAVSIDFVHGGRGTKLNAVVPRLQSERQLRRLRIHEILSNLRDKVLAGGYQEDMNFVLEALKSEFSEDVDFKRRHFMQQPRVARYVSAHAVCNACTDVVFGASRGSPSRERERAGGRGGTPMGTPRRASSSSMGGISPIVLRLHAVFGPDVLAAARTITRSRTQVVFHGQRSAAA